MTQTLHHYTTLIFLFFFLLSSSLFAQTGNKSEGCAPLSVHFTAPVGSSTYYWDFDDGGASVIQNPDHTFTAIKEHTVTFREAQGGDIIGTVIITIFPKPVPSFAADPSSGCVPHSVKFENTSTVDPSIMVTNYNWVFGDGMGTNATDDPEHLYGGVGEYTVSLKLETDVEGCDTTAAFPAFVKVTNPSGPIFTTDPFPPVACDPPLTVSFINNTPVGDYTLSWDFGSGDTFSGQNPPEKTYSETGNYPVELTLTDDAGCVKTAALTIGVGTPNPIFTVPNDTLCLGQIYTMINSSAIGQYFWEFEDGTPSTSTQKDPNFRFDEPGEKTIKLTLGSMDGSCMGEKVITVFVEDVSIALTVDPEYSCNEPVTLNYTCISPANATWDYTFGDGTKSDVQNPTLLYVDLDTTTHSLEGEKTFTSFVKVTSPAGCTASASVSTVINTPNALFIPDVVRGCAPLLVTFNDTSYSNEDIVEWHWDFGDGNTLDATNDNDVQHTYNTAGEYPVVLVIVNSAGCRDTSYTQIMYVGKELTIDFNADKTDICLDEEVTFMDLSNNPDIDAYHFHSDGERLSHCFDDKNPTWSFHDVGAQDVTLEVIYNGCHTLLEKSDFINVKGPLASFVYEMDCGTPFDFNFTSHSGDADEISWDFGDGSVVETTTPVSHTYATTGDYKVLLIAKNNTSGCPDSRDSVIVHVRDIKADFTIPEFVCKGADLELDASTSVDVNAFCNKGYMWKSSERRPVVLGEANFPTEYSFGESGDQWVELTVQDVNGCIDVLTRNTRVTGVEVTASADKTLICVPNSVSFTATATADTTLQMPVGKWEFMDQGATATGLTATHNFTDSNVGVFSVTYTVKDIFGCEDSKTIPISVYKPTSIISAMPNPNICVGETITFSATDYTAQGSSLAWAWDFGNGTTSSNQSDDATYNNAGNFDVVLNFTEIATGCTESTTTSVNVQDFPNANFISSVDGQSVLCHPLNVEFTDSSTPITGLTTNWVFGNGGTAIGSNVFTVYPKGDFEITQYTTTSNGCTDSLKKTITTVGPEGDFTLDKSVVCLGDEIIVALNTSDTVDIGSYYFDFGDGTEVHNETPVSHNYSFVGGQPIKLVLTSVDGGCTYTVEKPINIIDIKAAFTNSNMTLSGCESESFTFVNQSTGANQYQWDFGDGLTSNLEDPIHSYVEAGTYTVTLSISNTEAGCEDEITHEITILPKVPVVATGGSLCAGDSIEISVSNPDDGYMYTWSPEIYASTPLDSSTFVMPPVTTDFIVAADDGSGCIGRDTVTVFVVEPLMDISFDTTIFAGTTIELPIQYMPPYVFNWNPEGGLSCLVCSNPSITPEEDITYTLNISDDAGCFENTGVFIIRVFPEDIDIPNAFTPNGDELNQYFNVILDEDVAVLLDITAFRIYDRWGQKVYDNENSDKGWDGTFKGKDMPSDVYPYILEATFLNGKVKTLKGNVTLLR